MKVIKKIINDNWLIVFVFSFFVRILFVFFPSFNVDMGAWISWSHRLSFGLSNFYSNETWTQYTPGFLYWLYLISKLNLINKVIIVLPVIFADIITGYLIASFCKKENLKKIVFLLYVLNPAVIFVGSVWGQIDGILSLFLLLAVYFLTIKKNIYFSSLSLFVAFLIKPQAIMLFPLFMFVGFKNFGSVKLLFSFLIGICFAIFISIPFFTNDIFFGLFKKVIEMSNGYKYTSLFAYNIWLFITGMWKNDTNFQKIGILISGIFTFICFLPFVANKKINSNNAFLLAFMSSLIFFLFPTRVHERYLFPFFPLFLSFIVLSSKHINKKIYLWFALSLLFFFNVYYAYAYYSDNFLRNSFFMILIDELKYLIAISYLLVFLIFLINTYKKYFYVFKNIKINPLILILVFAFVTRIYNLQNPKTHYFDEVYHAFTAQKMVEHDVHAWDWRGIHPKGYAYEWTHPPVAKEIMALTISLFGNTAFYWRLPSAIFGTLCVYLVYLIAKNIFDEKIAINSALVFSLDGLVLVLSRIGMNDIYFLFFALLSLFLILKNKYFYSAVFYGLSLASKWSALWLSVVILVAFLKKQKKDRSIKFVYFFFIPLIVYFLTYILMFFVGHDLSVFVGLQKQMWWYHTRLNATHPFSSPWWSWPFLIRPIWLYTSGPVQNKIANIYALGNPIIFWFGILAVLFLAFNSLTTKNKKYGFIVFSYFVFFVPWALSPRIMFLYHYLPSIPFLSIALGVLLEKYKQFKLYFFVLAVIVFLYFYPRFTGLYVSDYLNNSYRWFSSW